MLWAASMAGLLQTRGFPPGRLQEDHGPRTEGVAIAFIIIEIIIVALRIISRRIIRARLALDDFLIFPGLLFCVGLCILAIGAYRILSAASKHLLADIRQSKCK